MADYREGTSVPDAGLGMAILVKDRFGTFRWPASSDPDPATTNELHVPAAATAAILTFTAEAGNAHVLSGVIWSYSAAPTGGRLTIADGSDTVFDIDITAAGPNYVDFGPQGKQGTPGRAMVVTLASGAGAVVGKLNATGHWTRAVVSSILDFGDESNSGLLPLFF